MDICKYKGFVIINKSVLNVLILKIILLESITSMGMKIIIIWVLLKMNFSFEAILVM